MESQSRWLREARVAKGWTQVEAAERLGLSQPYLSLLENGSRPFTTRLLNLLEREFTVPPTALPLSEGLREPSEDDLAGALGALGYPGFQHTKRTVLNPAELLLDALGRHDLDPRVTEALPWVVLQHPDLDWQWLVPQAKLHDLQNRVGCVVAVAREVAERKAPDVLTKLKTVEESLEPSRLVREDTLCRESMTQSERRWLREHRPASAKHWNMLTSLQPDELSYG